MNDDPARNRYAQGPLLRTPAGRRHAAPCLALLLILGGLLLLPGCARQQETFAANGPGPASVPGKGASPPAASGKEGVAPQSDAIRQMEAQVARRINEIRVQHGLEPLAPNERLAGVAREHSRRMARENFFSHTPPSGGTVVDRVRAADIRFRLVGENLFQSWNVPQPVHQAVQGWMASVGHRKNILREGVTQTGVGIWKEGKTYYFTQLFLKPT